MSQEILVKVNANVASAVKNIGETKEALGDLIDIQIQSLEEIKKSNEANRKAFDKLEKQTKKAEGGFKSFFKVMKGAAILTVIVKSVQALGSAFSANQTVADTFANVSNTIGSVMRQVADAFVDATKSLNEATGGFDATKKVIQGLITIGMTPLMLAIDLIKGGVYAAQLAWEESFFGDGDPKTIAELNKKLDQTGQSLSETFTELGDAASSVSENFSEATGEIGKVAEVASEQIKKINVETTFSNQEKLTALRNETKLAIAENEKLQFVYQREAELQRQIRDNVQLSVADRQKANDELGLVLEKQLKLQMENAKTQLEAAQFELSLNKDSIELKEQLLLAEKNIADVKENVDGFRSEQLVNQQGLELEAIDLVNSKAEAEANRALAEKNFAAEKETDEIARLEKLRENIDTENEIETTRLQSQIDRYQVGTQARQDAEQQLLDFQQQSKQKGEKLDDDISKKTIARDKAVAKQKLDITKQTFGALAGILGENSAAGKAAAIAAATINTYQGVTEVLANKTTLPEPFGTIQKIVSIAGILGTGFKTVKEITAVPKPNIPGAKSGGGGGRGINKSIASAPAAPPSFNVVGASQTSQLTETINKKEKEPQRAYVVSNDVTTAQSLDRQIVNNASI